LVEEQLSDNREWLFDTELPSLADISVHFVLAWIASFRGVESLYDATQIPMTIKVRTNYYPDTLDTIRPPSGCLVS